MVLGGTRDEDEGREENLGGTRDEDKGREKNLEETRKRDEMILSYFLVS
jgi:hypothetical protein